MKLLGNAQFLSMHTCLLMQQKTLYPENSWNTFHSNPGLPGQPLWHQCLPQSTDFPHFSTPLIHDLNHSPSFVS